MRQVGKRQRWDGTTQTWMEANDGSQVFKTEGDFTALYQQNRDLRNEKGLYQHSGVFSDDWRGNQVAEIDPLTILRWKGEGFDFFDYTNPERGKELKKRLLGEPWLLTTDKRFDLK